MQFLIILPILLTLAIVLFIMVYTNQYSIDYDSDEYNPFEEFEEDGTLRVAVYDDKAYFVMDNVFYEADTTREPDFSTTREIDIMSMPQKELSKLLIILDELEEYGKELE